MSWDFSLKSPVTDETLTVEPHFMYGGNVKVEYVDGTPEASERSCGVECNLQLLLILL